MAKATDVVRLLLGSTALCFSLLDAQTASASKSVTAHLAAKWPETPLLLEARWVRAGHSAEPSAEGGSAGSLGPDLAVCRPFSSLSAAGAPSCWALEHPLRSGYPCAALTCNSFSSQFILCLTYGFSDFRASV